MARFSGIVGFSEGQKETAPGVWTDSYIERRMTGAVIRAATNLINDQTMNTNLQADNNLSVVGDQYSFENFSNIRYVIWMGQKWHVSSVEVQRPRIVISLGSVFNE